MRNPMGRPLVSDPLPQLSAAGAGHAVPPGTARACPPTPRLGHGPPAGHYRELRCTARPYVGQPLGNCSTNSALASSRCSQLSSTSRSDRRRRAGHDGLVRLFPSPREIALPAAAGASLPSGLGPDWALCTATRQLDLPSARRGGIAIAKLSEIRRKRRQRWPVRS